MAENFLGNKVSCFVLISEFQLRAGIVDKLNDYPWSSHKGYMSKAVKWEWLHKNYILDMFSKDKKLQIIAYKRFISSEEPGELIEHYSKINMPSILGSEKFTKWVRDRFPHPCY
jgi:hypothetical protein